MREQLVPTNSVRDKSLSREVAHSKIRSECLPQCLRGRSQPAVRARVLEYKEKLKKRKITGRQER